jgi:hypothetical protein
MLLCAVLSAESKDTEHRGSLGLTVASGPQLGVLSGRLSGAYALPIFAPIEIGVTAGLFDRTELRAAARIQFPLPLGAEFHAGIRSSYGFNELKTFFDAGAVLVVTPFLLGGIRVGGGVQYDFSQVAGVFAAAGIQFVGSASGTKFSAEALVGIQFRTYIFESAN